MADYGLNDMGMPQAPPEPRDEVLEMVQRARAQQRAKELGLDRPLSMGEFLKREGPTALMGAAPMFARALPAIAGGAALFGSPSQAGDPASEGPDLTKLYQDQAALQKRIDETTARRENFRPPGGRKPDRNRDPQFTEADDALKQLNTQFSGLQNQISTLEARNTPEAKIEGERLKREADAEAKKKTMNTSVKEQLSDIMPYVPAASGALAGVLGYAIKRPQVTKFNDQMTQLNTRWESAVKQGNKPLAKAIEKEFEAVNKSGPGGTWPAIGAGAAVGELGQLGPVVSDYSKALPGSDLYENTTGTMTNWKEVLGRIGTGALWGGLPAEVGALIASRGKVKPLGFKAETDAMPNQPQLPPGGPGPNPGQGGPPLAQWPAPAIPAPRGPQGGGGPAPLALLPAPPPAAAPAGAQPNTTLSGYLKKAAPPMPAPANEAGRPKGLRGGQDWDDRMSGSKVRNKKTGRLEDMPSE
jgi:hypothetical protein